MSHPQMPLEADNILPSKESLAADKVLAKATRKDDAKLLLVGLCIVIGVIWAIGYGVVTMVRAEREANRPCYQSEECRAQLSDYLGGGGDPVKLHDEVYGSD